MKGDGGAGGGDGRVAQPAGPPPCTALYCSCHCRICICGFCMLEEYTPKISDKINLANKLAHHHHQPSDISDVCPNEHYAYGPDISVQ